MIEIDFTTKSDTMPEYIVDKCGNKYLYDENGQPHSYNDMPAVIYLHGTKYWYNHGLQHRDNDLPAIIFKDGTKAWYKNGKLHRDNDLPAIMRSDGIKEYWIEGNFARRESP